jgi:quercetin dioxygenase-like cupin family protein
MEAVQFSESLMDVKSPRRPLAFAEPNHGYAHPIGQEDHERCFTCARSDTSVSVFLFHGKPGSGPGPHRHPYDEIQFIREGRGVWTVNGKTFEACAGDIFVIKAGEIHSFKAVGDSPLIQVDVHISPRFIQENL